MFNKICLLLLLTATISTNLIGQLKVVPSNRIHIGNEMTALSIDPTNLVTLAAFGRGTDTYRAGSKISFGDFGSPANGGVQAFIGENGTTDTDALQVHGKNGVHFSTGGAGDYEVARFTSNGDLQLRGTLLAGVQSTYSDSRLKKNILGLKADSSLQSLLKLRGVRYDLITDDHVKTLTNLNAIKPIEKKDQDALDRDKRNIQKKIDESKNQIGFVAQEVQQIYPQLVYADEGGRLSVNYVALVPVLVEALKAQQQQIEDLKTRIEKLEKK